MHGATLVVDVTYRCNARCRYCRWGDGKTGSRNDRPASELCADPAILEAANIGRVVLSGGEPLLHSEIDSVLQHYRSLQIQELVVITNGLVATLARLDARCTAGATGFAFSIDSCPDNDDPCARAMTRAQQERIFKNLRDARSLVDDRGIELTINCVLSAANCSLDAIERLVHCCVECGVSEIKFQPVFDDGYLGLNAPGLALGPEHSAVIRKIGLAASRWMIATNPPQFFDEVASVCEGHVLDGCSCSLDGSSLVLQSGGVVICTWISSTPARTAADLPRLSRDFRQARESCSTGLQCFCLQPRTQTWSFRDEDA